MTITAQALQISVPLVVAFHLFRVVVVNMGTQYIYTCVAWVFGGRRDS
jgi:exosortase/archaeosortase